MEKLAALVEARVPAMKTALPLLGMLLGILPDNEAAVLATRVPRKLRKDTLDALLQLGIHFAKSKPLLVIFEDIHWIDATSMELMSRMIETIRDLPVLLFITTRPGFEPEWIGRDNVHPLMLNRLDNETIENLILTATAGKSLPSEVVNHIISKADGIPLFAEELTKMVIESPLLIRWECLSLSPFARAIDHSHNLTKLSDRASGSQPECLAGGPSRLIDWTRVFPMNYCVNWWFWSQLYSTRSCCIWKRQS